MSCPTWYRDVGVGVRRIDKPRLTCDNVWAPTALVLGGPLIDALG